MNNETIADTPEVCAVCGTLMAENQDFCAKCGTRKGVQKQAVCVKCGAEILPEHEFCPKCGQKIIAAVSDTDVNNDSAKSAGQGKTKSRKKLFAIAVIGMAAVAVAAIFAILFFAGTFDRSSIQAKDSPKSINGLDESIDFKSAPDLSSFQEDYKYEYDSKSPVAGYEIKSGKDWVSISDNYSIINLAEESSVDEEYDKYRTDYDTVDDIRDRSDEMRALATQETLKTVKRINEKLGIDHEKILSQMEGTTGLMGKQSDTDNGYRITWSYSGNNGLSVLYERM